MKIISWNVNGIRAAIKKGFLDFIESQNPDIICIQETKARPEQVDIELPQYPYHYWNSAEKKGYSGTAVFTNQKPISVQNGMNITDHDHEGRVITLEYQNYFLTTVYTPNSKRELIRLDYRQNKWDADFLKFVNELQKSKPVVFCGDLNVAHKEIDLANPKTNRRNAGFTDEERAGFDNIIAAGFIDTFRVFESGGGHYSWWSYRANARARNIGWRIDYFIISGELRPKLISSVILPQVLGSDHAPIEITIDL